ncbi:reverse transcriptase domain-containing protein [Tanacetum coccineum]|uniref:Reverse transcriptase domain-containing protein n=1 Tax=Tanacetum coccineum TaxID=301880 RepID=A0ABQ5G0Z3_9ASTR
MAGMHCLCKLKESHRKDHFLYPFYGQLLEELAGNEYYCFLNGFSGFSKSPLTPLIRKVLLLSAIRKFAYSRMLSAMQCSRHVSAMTHLSLNWRRLFYGPRGAFVSAIRFLRKGLEVDRAKIDVIANYLIPTTVKGIRSFLGCKGEIAPDGFLAKKLTSKLLILKEREPRSRYLSRWKTPAIVCTAKEALDILEVATMDPPGDIMVNLTAKRSLTRFGAPSAFISDRETHFVMTVYKRSCRNMGSYLTALSTAITHKQRGQVEVSNQWLEKYLERTIGETVPLEVVDINKKDRKPTPNDKNEHGMEMICKSGQSQNAKSVSILKNQTVKPAETD